MAHLNLDVPTVLLLLIYTAEASVSLSWLLSHCLTIRHSHLPAIQAGRRKSNCKHLKETAFHLKSGHTDRQMYNPVYFVKSQIRAEDHSRTTKGNYTAEPAYPVSQRKFWEAQATSNLRNNTKREQETAAVSIEVKNFRPFWEGFGSSS